RPEVLLANAGEIVGVKPDDGAGIGRWDLRAARFALASVLRRRPEAYHEKVRKLDARRVADAADGLDGASGPGGADDAPASIHDIVMSKQAGLSAHLHYDPNERRSGLVRVLAEDADPTAAMEVRDLGDFAGSPWTVTSLARESVTLARDGEVRVGGVAHAVHAEKTIRIGGGRLDPSLALEVTVTNTGSATLDARLAIEWSTMLLGGGGNPSAWNEIAGARVAHDAAVNGSDLAAIASGNDFLGIRLDADLEPAEDVWIAPIQTVSNSE